MDALTRSRIAAFRARRSSWYALWALVALTQLAACAELLANSRPLLLRYQEALYLPVLQRYEPATFGQGDTYVVDYHALDAALGPDDWALWPPVRWGPYKSDPAPAGYPSPPDARHWLGTDDKGRDLLARLLYGYRLSMGFAVGAWLLAFGFGITVGALQGYYGGWVDLLGQRLTEIWAAIPLFFLVLILVALFEPAFWALVVLFAAFNWTTIAQYERAEFLALRRRDFVEAARAAGAGPLRIIARHILPNAITPVVTFTPFTIAGGITGIAALDYLGFGVQPPTPSWGELLRQALAHFSTAWWIATYTVASMFGVLLLLVFINEGVREAFDPRHEAARSERL